MRPSVLVMGSLATLLGGCGLSLDLDPPDPRAPRGGMDGGAGGIDGGGGANLDGTVTLDAFALDARVDATVEVDGGPTLAECGGISGLVDSFDGPSAEPEWGTVVGPMAGVDFVYRPPTGRGLGIRSSPGVTVGVASRFAYRFTNDGVTVHFTSLPAFGSGDAFEFGVFIDEGRAIGIAYVDGHVAGFLGDTRIGEIADYVHDQPGSFRIRDESGTVRFEVRYDSDVAWREIAMLALPDWSDTVYLAIAVEGNPTPSTLPGDLVVDGLNIDPETVPEPLCPAWLFQDDFSSGSLDPEWPHDQSETRTCFAESGGELLMAADPSMMDTRRTCSIRTAHAYQLGPEGLFFQLGSGFFPDPADFGIGMALQDVQGRTILVGCRDGDLVFVSAVGTVGVVIGPCPEQPFWGFREVGRTLTFEAGPTRELPSFTRGLDDPGIDVHAIGAGFVFGTEGLDTIHHLHVPAYNVSE